MQISAKGVLHHVLAVKGLPSVTKDLILLRLPRATSEGRALSVSLGWSTAKGVPQREGLVSSEFPPPAVPREEAYPRAGD